MSYNWAYLAIKHTVGAKRLFLRALGERRPARNAGLYMRHFGDRLTLAAEQLRIASREAGIPVLSSASEAVAVSVREINEAATASEEGDETAASQAWIGALDRLQRVKLLLDRDSPIHFRPWFVNPWRQYPRRIVASIPGRDEPPALNR